MCNSFSPSYSQLSLVLANLLISWFIYLLKFLLLCFPFFTAWVYSWVYGLAVVSCQNLWHFISQLCLGDHMPRQGVIAYLIPCRASPPGKLPPVCAACACVPSGHTWDLACLPHDIMLVQQQQQQQSKYSVPQVAPGNPLAPTPLRPAPPLLALSNAHENISLWINSSLLCVRVCACVRVCWGVCVCAK